ncbi:PspC domain-containing protein [Oceanobacillus luteolus]|uniref:PspC domain-containing protein n=1 Tax=Oceanobacillus luteolus TaxID=1274358 RepID=A0ABW4HR80_9BACI|nr:PspC domain-containing protein [Oceanobacillus luteolus]MCM3739170.1 PspC domain-containing protein [Oceanobacillus luteolus]
MKKLYRSSDNRFIAGVFGGLSDYFNIDATILRLIFVICLIPSFFTFALIYAVAALIIPKDMEIY